MALTNFLNLADEEALVAKHGMIYGKEHEVNKEAFKRPNHTNSKTETLVLNCPHLSSSRSLYLETLLKHTSQDYLLRGQT